MKTNSSRRKFLSYLGITVLSSTIPVSLFASNKVKNKEEYILVNGWLLKKEDLYDI